MMPAATSLPALVALIFKGILLGYAWRSPARNRTTRLYLALLLAFSFQNLVEFLVLNDVAGEDFSHAELYGRLYFAMVIPALALLLHLSLRLSAEAPTLDRIERHAYLIYVPAIVLEALLPGRLLIAGFRPFEYSLLRDPGPLYFLFETYATTYMLAALTGLIYGARGSRSALARTRNRLWLLALLPMALLIVYLIVANHFGWTRLTSTVYLPLALTFFLAVTAYATHEHRLFDIAFFIPGSRVRKRKTAFYRRLQATVAEIADMPVRGVLHSLAEVLHCSVAFVGGPNPILAVAPRPPPAGASHRQAMNIMAFPQHALERIDQIVVAQEIADRMPQTHELMKQHGVGAIVPFRGPGGAANWMLLSDHFSEEVYTPLDFRRVEELFERIGERFLDKVLLLRTELADAREDLRSKTQRLAAAWEELVALRAEVRMLGAENHSLRHRNAELLRERSPFPAPDPGGPGTGIEKTLEERLEDFEASAIRSALARCDGNLAKAARSLGLRTNTLHHKMKRLGIGRPGESEDG